jgi:hypothetical protein
MIVLSKYAQETVEKRGLQLSKRAFLLRVSQPPTRCPSPERGRWHLDPLTFNERAIVSPENRPLAEKTGMLLFDRPFHVPIPPALAPLNAPSAVISKKCSSCDPPRTATAPETCPFDVRRWTLHGPQSSSNPGPAMTQVPLVTVRRGGGRAGAVASRIGGSGEPGSGRARRGCDAGFVGTATGADSNGSGPAWASADGTVTANVSSDRASQRCRTAVTRPTASARHAPADAPSRRRVRTRRGRRPCRPRRRCRSRTSRQG